MARIVKEEEYAAQRSKILDSALRFIYTKGYDDTSIQDILADLQISKGAFYHYFDSKAELLNALVDHLMDEAECLLNPIVQEAGLPALEKLQRWIQTTAHWKVGQKAFMLALLRVWYTDANALVRQKQLAATIKRIAPMLTAIIRQGVAEGVFTMAYPEQIGGLLVGVSQGATDAMAELLLMAEPPPDALSQITNMVAAYSEALERVLGAPAGSLRLADEATMQEWLVKAPASRKPRRPRLVKKGKRT